MLFRNRILFIGIFLLVVLNYIPTNANGNGIDLDENLKFSQTTTWLEPSLIAKDDTFENISRIIESNDTLYAINDQFELLIYDNSLPSNMSHLSTESTYEYQNFVLDQNMLYLTHETGITVFDVSNQNSIHYVGGNDTYFNSISHSGITGIAIKNQILYVGTKGNGIVILNSTNLENIFVIGTYLDGPFESYDIMEIRDTVLYVADQQGNYLKIIDISNPTFPSLIKYVSLGPIRDPNGMAITLNTVYLSIENFGFMYINITDLSEARIRYSVETKISAKPLSIDVIDSIAVASTISDGIIIFDVSNYNYNLITNYKQNHLTYDLQITSDLIYTANFGDGIKILDYGRDDDDDGLTNGEEKYLYFTNPNNRDSDNDGILDGDEIEIGSNPLYPNTNTTWTSTTVITQDEPLNSLAIIVGILLIIGAVFFYQRRKSLRSEELFPNVAKKSGISKQKRDSIKSKVQPDGIGRSLSCPSCGTTNPPQSTFCIQCGIFLD